MHSKRAGRHKSPSDVLDINQVHSMQPATLFFPLPRERKGESKADLIKFKVMPQYIQGYHCYGKGAVCKSYPEQQHKNFTHKYTKAR